MVKKGSDYYFVGPFITGEIFLKYDSIDILSPVDVLGRVINDGIRNIIIKPMGELFEGEVMGKCFPYCILGDFDNVYDTNSPFQILEKDGKVSIFYAKSELIKPSSIENGNIDLNEFLIPYVSQDESEEIYWFEDVREMKYANSNKNFK